MTYTVGLIGCGRVGLLLEEDPLRVKPASHIGGIQKLREMVPPTIDLELIALCDIHPERLDYASQKWNVSHTYSHYQELIDKEKPDLLIIATWTSSHHDIAVYAAQRGVKGIILEKPAAATINKAIEIVNICRKNGVKLVVNHERRWDPLYCKTKEIIEDKRLGELRTIYGNVLSRSALQGDWQEIIKEVGGGPLLHDGTHLVDMIRYFAGDIASINGHVKREDASMGVETSASALLLAQNGVTIFLESGGMRNYFNFELDLHFQNGRIKVGNGIREYYVVENSRRYTGFKDLVRQEFPPLTTHSDPFTGAIMEVIRAIEDDVEPESSGLDACKAMEIIFAIYHSAGMKGKTVTLPLPLKMAHPLKKMFRKGMM